MLYTAVAFVYDDIHCVCTNTKSEPYMPTSVGNSLYAITVTT